MTPRPSQQQADDEEGQDEEDNEAESGAPPPPPRPVEATDSQSDQGHSSRMDQVFPSKPTAMMQSMLCVIAFIEGADMQLLWSLVFWEMDEFGMKMSQGISMSLAAPFWGILADRGVLRRKNLLVAATVGQGIASVLLAFKMGLAPMTFLRALNGFFLAALRPISNGIIANETAEQHWGKIFGRVNAAHLVGSSVVVLAVVPVDGLGSTLVFNEFEWWQVVSVVFGILTMCLSVLVACFLREPHHLEIRSEHKGLRAVLEEAAHLWHFLKKPTFCIMIVQGIFGTIPWIVMSEYLMQYLKLLGFSSVQVGLMAATRHVAAIFGNILGGLIADALTLRLGLCGRPLSAQITVVLGIPIADLILKNRFVHTFATYVCLTAVFGLTASWAQSGTNFPVLSHIAPPHSRSRLMAWEMALENSVACAMGQVLVPLLAEATDFNSGVGEDGLEKDLAAATALGTAMTTTICIPWVVTFLVYSLMHWTYPHDVGLEQDQDT